MGARASHGAPVAPRAVGKGAATELSGLCGDAAPAPAAPAGGDMGGMY